MVGADHARLIDYHQVDWVNLRCCRAAGQRLCEGQPMVSCTFGDGDVDGLAVA